MNDTRIIFVHKKRRKKEISNFENEKITGQRNGSSLLSVLIHRRPSLGQRNHQLNS